ncbi:transcriptional regulator [Pseudomonas sp. ABC1]|uniref:transcriptional regulator n=1 Tax=Pseudomonas sp. ABC1 TaxID=2748080 RepID=UPI0015C34F29|nr:transcriptional regulator [Pseudomonas sp. ABC1]QLF91729.1 transcriptional regulator [Pseudomonas sp. ABC1]
MTTQTTETDLNSSSQTEKLEFSQRLRDAMEASGYACRPGILEREFNARYWGKPVTFQAVSRWLRGQSIPAQDKLQVLSEWLNVEPQALRFGDKAVSRIRENRSRWEKGEPAHERATIDAYLSLPLEQRKIAREVIMALSKLHKFESSVR